MSSRWIDDKKKLTDYMRVPQRRNGHDISIFCWCLRLRPRPTTMQSDSYGSMTFPASLVANLVHSNPIVHTEYLPTFTAHAHKQHHGPKGIKEQDFGTVGSRDEMLGTFRNRDKRAHTSQLVATRPKLVGRGNLADPASVGRS